MISTLNGPKQLTGRIPTLSHRAISLVKQCGQTVVSCIIILRVVVVGNAVRTKILPDKVIISLASPVKLRGNYFRGRAFAQIIVAR